MLIAAKGRWGLSELIVGGAGGVGQPKGDDLGQPVELNSNAHFTQENLHKEASQQWNRCATIGRGGGDRGHHTPEADCNSAGAKKQALVVERPAGIEPNAAGLGLTS